MSRKKIKTVKLAKMEDGDTVTVRANETPVTIEFDGKVLGKISASFKKLQKATKKATAEGGAFSKALENISEQRKFQSVARYSDTFRNEYLTSEQMNKIIRQEPFGMRSSSGRRVSPKLHVAATALSKTTAMSYQYAVDRLWNAAEQGKLSDELKAINGAPDMMLPDLKKDTYRLKPGDVKTELWPTIENFKFDRGKGDDKGFERFVEAYQGKVFASTGIPMSKQEHIELSKEQYDAWANLWLTKNGSDLAEKSIVTEPMSDMDPGRYKTTLNTSTGDVVIRDRYQRGMGSEFYVPGWQQVLELAENPPKLVGIEYMTAEDTKPKPRTVEKLGQQIKGKYKTGDVVYVLDPHPIDLLGGTIEYDFAKVLTWIDKIRIDKFTVGIIRENTFIRDENNHRVPGYVCVKEGNDDDQFQIYETHMSKTKQEAVDAGVALLQKARDSFNKGIDALYGQEED